MKSSIYYILIASSFLGGVCSCDSDSKPLTLQPFTSLAAFNPILHDLVDTDVDALLHASITITHGGGTTYEYANAAFITEDGPAFPERVQVNQYVLSKDYTIYTAYIPKLQDSLDIKWEVIGFDGGSFFDTTSYPKLISPHSTSFGDTVSKASGFALSYGRTGIPGSIITYARFSPGLTRYFKDSLSALNGSGNVGKAVPDTGVISFNSEDLASFTPEKYIVVELIRFKYKVALSSTNRKIGVLTETITTIPLYLKP